jgi:hypothetical protein
MGFWAGITEATAPVARQVVMRIGFWPGVLCTGAVLLLPTAAAAWELVGTQQARFSNDLDTASVEIVQFAVRESHTQLLFCAEERPLHLRDAEVILAKGARHSFILARLLRSGTCTEAIDLAKTTPSIREILIRYDRPPGLAPIIKIYAR